MTAAPRVRPAPGLAAAFAEALPPEALVTDAADRAVLSSDIAGPAPVTPDLLLRPSSEAEVLRLVAVARREGAALHPRGGGWSYTGGFAPGRAPAALVDLSRLKGVTVGDDGARVGAGVTWAELDAALAPRGLRAPSFGPLSGLGATVGGSAAQNGGFFGAAGHGPYGAGTVREARVVAGTGDLVGLAAGDRVGGGFAPQPLAGDCGAFGLKTELTLALIPRREAAAFASFAFEEGAAALAALAALAGLPGLGEAYVFDPGTHANLARTGFSVLESAAIAGDLLGAGGSILGRVTGLLRTARAGTAFVADLGWSLHLCVEGRATEVAESLAEAERRACAHGGRAIPDTIPRVTRARPFRPIKALLGPEGELWLPLHGVVQAQAAAPALAAVDALLERHREPMARSGVRAVVLAVLMQDRIVLEPQLFWPDALSPLHLRLVRPEQRAAYGARPENLPARRFVRDLRRDLIDALDRSGAWHFQIGRAYAGHPGPGPEVREVWRRWKAKLDPDGIMNPGALGLPDEAPPAREHEPGRARAP